MGGRKGNARTCDALGGEQDGRSGLETHTDSLPSDGLDSMPIVMTAEQLAEVLPYTAASIRKMARDGHIPARKPVGGSRWLFPRDGVIAWLHGHDVGGDAL